MSSNSSETENRTARSRKTKSRGVAAQGSGSAGPDRAQGDTRPRLDDFICFTIYSANHAMNRVYKPLLDKLGVTYPQYIALTALWEEDGQTVGEICETLSLESSTVTPLLKRLEKMKLLQRLRDPTDERQVRISLTPEGRGLETEARKIPGCILAASGFSEKALFRLQGQIADLRENLTRAAPE